MEEAPVAHVLLLLLLMIRSARGVREQVECGLVVSIASNRRIGRVYVVRRHVGYFARCCCYCSGDWLLKIATRLVVEIELRFASIFDGRKSSTDQCCCHFHFVHVVGVDCLGCCRQVRGVVVVENVVCMIVDDETCHVWMIGGIRVHQGVRCNRGSNRGSSRGGQRRHVAVGARAEGGGGGFRRRLAEHVLRIRVVHHALELLELAIVCRKVVMMMMMMMIVGQGRGRIDALVVAVNGEREGAVVAAQEAVRRQVVLVARHRRRRRHCVPLAATAENTLENVSRLGVKGSERLRWWLWRCLARWTKRPLCGGVVELFLERDGRRDATVVVQALGANVHDRWCVGVLVLLHRRLHRLK